MRPDLIVFFLLLVPTGLLAAAGSDEESQSAAITAPTEDFSQPERYEALPAGAATVLKAVNRDSFSHASANMSFERELQFMVGNGIFKKLWVTAPASTQSSDGLGPLYNARACQRCHLRDGRGQPPQSTYEIAESMFLRLSIPPQNEAQRQALASFRAAVIPDPTYGGQLQSFGIPGHLAEGRMRIDYEARPVTLADGTTVTLRAPRYSVSDLNYGPMHPQVMLSPRVAPPLLAGPVSHAAISSAAERISGSLLMPTL